VGLIAYVAVAAFYAVFDLLAARGALYTLDLLGKVVFRGLHDPAVLQLPFQHDLRAMAWYNGLHLVISLAIGFVVTEFVAHAERRPARAHLVGLTIVMGFVVTVIGVGLLTSSVRPVLPWWSIVVANALAVLLAGSYLVREHPGLWRRLIPFIA
jgi:predicted exporter